MNINQNKPIKIYTSRYGDDRYIQQIKENEYLIYGKSEYMRVGGNEDIEFIDFEGGPMIGIRENIKEWTGTEEIIVEIIPVYMTQVQNCYKLITK